MPEATYYVMPTKLQLMMKIKTDKISKQMNGDFHRDIYMLTYCQNRERERERERDLNGKL